MFLWQGEFSLDSPEELTEMKNILMRRLLVAVRAHAIGVILAGMLTVLKTFKYLRKAPPLNSFQHLTYNVLVIAYYLIPY